MNYNLTNVELICSYVRFEDKTIMLHNAVRLVSQFVYLKSTSYWEDINHQTLIHTLHLSSDVLNIFCSRLIALHGRKQQLKYISTAWFNFRSRCNMLRSFHQIRCSKILLDCCDFQFLTIGVFLLKRRSRWRWIISFHVLNIIKVQCKASKQSLCLSDLSLKTSRYCDFYFNSNESGSRERCGCNSVPPSWLLVSKAQQMWTSQQHRTTSAFL